jgi:glycosidase
MAGSGGLWRATGRASRFPGGMALAVALALAGLPGTASEARGGSAAGANASRPTDRGVLGQPVLHVPSPDWRDQVLYFLLTDRFDDGDPANNDQGAGEFAAADPTRYNGGDLRGVARRLDYIRGLGATGVWITPPVRNRWWDPVARHGGYHGYWARDFSALDPHLGDLGDLQELSRQLHGKGMVLVQDIVLNHVADYFDLSPDWRADAPAIGYVQVPEHDGATAPTQPPFDLNDPRRAADRVAGIYHWTPRIRDFQDPAQLHDGQMSGLDDLASGNPAVRAALRRAYGDWIRRAGVDGFRVDTAFYVPNDALDDFMYARDAGAPGIATVAAQTGRAAFHVFGEGFAIDKPFEDAQQRRIDALMRRDGGGVLLPGMLNFPLYADAGAVFARGAPTAQLAYRIEATMRVHADPWRMPSFLDNHDVDRFLAGGSDSALRQALLMLFALPGIPTIYYGTEQGLRVQRAAMFAAGSDSGGVDHFDTNAPLYRHIARLAALRREHRVLSRGRPTLLASNAAGPGVLAWRMQGADGDLLVAVNTADHEALADNLQVAGDGAAAGAPLRLAPLFAIDGVAPIAQTNAAGTVSLRLPPRGGYVWRIEPAPDAGVASPRAARIDMRDAEGKLRMLPTPRAGAFAVAGVAEGLDDFLLVVDGDLSRAQRVAVDPAGSWSATVDTGDMVDPGVVHRLAAWADAPGLVSPGATFTARQDWRPLADVADPIGDDKGPAGRYRYPADWTTPTLDLRRVRVEGAGGALRIHLTLGALSTLWNPPNGFDHVAFNVFVELPGEAGGATALPFQNASLPAGMRWHRRLRAHGWSNALFTDAGAGAAADGTPTGPAAGIAVDAASRTVSFTLPRRALGDRESLSGARVHVALWDYDGGYRALQAEPGGSILGGGDGARDPLVMDDSAVIVLP